MFYEYNTKSLDEYYVIMYVVMNTNELINFKYKHWLGQRHLHKSHALYFLARSQV